MFLCGVVAAIARYQSLPGQNLWETIQPVACRVVGFHPEYYTRILALDYLLQLQTPSSHQEKLSLHLELA
jgi:hypothetical protein